MDIISILTALLTLTAGIGVFLVACTMMSSNLESAASRRLKQLFSHTGNNKLVGVGIGTPRTPNVLPTTSSMWRKPFGIYNK
jgi:phosphate:Na+ symporter